MSCSPYLVVHRGPEGYPFRLRSRLSDSDEPLRLIRQPQPSLICLLATASFDFGLHLYELLSFGATKG
jgi:hypothetical protein